MRRSRSRKLISPQTRGRRSGVITLELIVALPILVILIMVVVEFAIIYQVNQEVAASARFGAKLAAEITRQQTAPTHLGNYNQPATPNNLKTRIDQYLANHGLTASCEVILQHDACVPNPTQMNPTVPPANCQCSTPAAALPPGEPPPGEAYVRVTVCERLAGNVPNLLSTFGLDLDDLTLQQSTVFRIETNNQSPQVSVSGTLVSAPVNYAVIAGGFPTKCGSSVTMGNPPGTTVIGTSVVINFDSLGTSDAEDPTASLTYSWSTTGIGTNPLAVPSGGTGTTYTPALRAPPDPNTGAGTQPDNVNTYTVTLTVTDTCGASSLCTMTVELRTRDSVP